MAVSQSLRWGLHPNWATSMWMRWTVGNVDNDDVAGVNYDRPGDRRRRRQSDDTIKSECGDDG